MFAVKTGRFTPIDVLPSLSRLMNADISTDDKDELS